MLDEKKKYYIDVFIKLVGKMYGETASKVIKYIIDSGGSAAEEYIGREANVKSNDARRILQKLGNDALLTCRPRKDGDKVLHYWFINWDQIETELINRLKKTRSKLESLLKFETNNILYVCPSCGRIYTDEQAFDNEFKCAFDNEPLEEINRDEAVDFLSKVIEKIDRELEKTGV